MTVATLPELFDKHKATLDAALDAIRARTYWSAYQEIPSGKFYGETAKADGAAAFQAQLNAPFALDEPATDATVGRERSPYGFDLGVQYPKVDLERTIEAAISAGRTWRRATPQVRAGVALEILARLNARSFELASAVMHTTGQGFTMAFQAGGPHAQDRALEAVAYAYAEMSGIPERALWEKPQGKNPPVRLEKRFRIVPRGVALVIGCSTFPTWNAYPGLFASLVTGNAVIVKPHPLAILPLAITVGIMRDVLRQSGFDPNVVQLAADEPGSTLAKDLALRPEVGIIDYTGSSSFGTWLEQHATQALVYTEKAGVNSIVVDSTDDLAGMARNIAFSLSLYSGQMCTTPQNVFVPRAGISTGTGRATFDEVAAAISDAVVALTADDARAVEVLGAIATDETLARLERAPALGEVVLASRTVRDERFPSARIHTPLILKVEAESGGAHEHEQFGPIAFLIPTDGTPASLAVAMRLAKERGAITAALYSTDAKVIEEAEDAAAEAGVALSTNLYGNIFVNQSSAFSDYHVSGANPAGNAALTDAQFVAGRFRIVQSRVPAAE